MHLRSAAVVGGRNEQRMPCALVLARHDVGVPIAVELHETAEVGAVGFAESFALFDHVMTGATCRSSARMSRGLRDGPTNVQLTAPPPCGREVGDPDEVRRQLVVWPATIEVRPSSRCTPAPARSRSGIPGREFQAWARASRTNAGGFMRAEPVTFGRLVRRIVEVVDSTGHGLFPSRTTTPTGQSPARSRWHGPGHADERGDRQGARPAHRELFRPELALTCASNILRRRSRCMTVLDRRPASRLAQPVNSGRRGRTPR